jgi:hypothetical protein
MGDPFIFDENMSLFIPDPFPDFVRMRVSERSAAHRWPLVGRCGMLAATVVGASLKPAANIVYQLLTER